MAQALERAPCLVSFSGGRDSSALLSLAVNVARAEGLPLPIPATLVFPGSSPTDEEEWQTLVLEHLGVGERLRIVVHDELDAVGPVSTAALRRHGLLWPFNVHFHIPIFERAAGGTVITGFGGDELAQSSASARAARAFSRWHRPTWADVLAVGFAASPAFVRRMVHRRRATAHLIEAPWLSPEGVRQVARAWAVVDAQLPIGWEAAVRRWMWRDRYIRLCLESFAILAEYHGVDVRHPFVEREVLDALASAGGFSGLGSREELLYSLVGDLLPDRTLRRSSKAIFNDPMWTPIARAFARSWSGGGVDERLVDVAALRSHWATDHPSVLSATLLQKAWLHDHARR